MAVVATAAPVGWPERARPAARWTACSATRRNGARRRSASMGQTERPMLIGIDGRRSDRTVRTRRPRIRASRRPARLRVARTRIVARVRRYFFVCGVWSVWNECNMWSDMWSLCVCARCSLRWSVVGVRMLYNRAEECVMWFVEDSLCGCNVVCSDADSQITSSPLMRSAQ